MTTMTVSIREKAGKALKAVEVVIEEQPDGRFTVNGLITDDVWREVLHIRNGLILSLAGTPTMEVS